jgi:hypothetical protein
MIAAEDGNTEFVRLLLDAGASTKNPRGKVCVLLASKLVPY